MIILPPSLYLSMLPIETDETRRIGQYPGALHRVWGFCVRSFMLCLYFFIHSLYEFAISYYYTARDSDNYEKICIFAI